MLIDVKKSLEIIKKGTVDLINEQELLRKLNKNQPLKIKLGADPSAPDLHLGHYVVLKKLKELQKLGHDIIFLIGDFTGMIGDPTGKNKTRKSLSREDVLVNAETYKKQIFKILDADKTFIRFNSEWHLKKPFHEVLEITSRYTVARILERDDFSKRYKSGDSINITEMLYPLIQGYDSVALKADIEVGGSDQLFNLLVGRTLQKEYGQEAQCVLTMPLLEGLDGKNKMSKSLGNYIALTDSPKDIFGKVMSLPDDLIFRYFLLVTDVPLEKITSFKNEMVEGENPRDLKVLLAYELVKNFYDGKVAEFVREEFFKVFSKKEIPQDISELEVSETEIEVLELIKKVNLFKSNGEIRRLLLGGGVRINDEKIVDPKQMIIPQSGMIMKIGKKDFFKIKK